MMTDRHLTYSERAQHSSSTVAKRLLTLMDHKKSNLAVSADVSTTAELLHLADELGPHICVLKTHIDIIQDFTPELPKKLRALADQHDFLIFEDRKFADIGNTVKQQFRGGIYRIADWADIINAHTLPGPGIIEGLKNSATDRDSGILLIAEMSSSGHLLNSNYQQQTLDIANTYNKDVFGYITQHAISRDSQWINFTPGIHLDQSGDSLGQQYKSPKEAILQQGTDVIIVGRGIIQASDPVTAAAQYRQQGWLAYTQRCQSAQS